MAFDGLFTVAMINELKGLETGRISKFINRMHWK